MPFYQKQIETIIYIYIYIIEINHISLYYIQPQKM